MAAALKTYRNGAWRTLTSLKVYRSGAWRTLRTLKIYRSGTWQLIGNFIPALSLSASPSTATGTSGGDGIHPAYATSEAVTATPTGGVSPYTYAWTQISGGTFTVTNPSSATTYFRAALPVGGDTSGVFRCTCTDSISQIATADVTVNLTY